MLVEGVSDSVEDQQGLLEVGAMNRVQSDENRFLKSVLEFKRALLVVIALHVLTDLLAVSVDEAYLVKNIVDDTSERLDCLVLLLQSLNHPIVFAVLRKLIKIFNKLVIRS